MTLILKERFSLISSTNNLTNKGGHPKGLVTLHRGLNTGYIRGQEEAHEGIRGLEFGLEGPQFFSLFWKEKTK